MSTSSGNHEEHDLSKSMSRMQLNDREEDCGEQLGRGCRQKTLSLKAKENAIHEVLKKKSKLERRLDRKMTAIDDLMYSKENEVTVKEELQQLNSIFTMLQDINDGMLLDDDHDDWFEIADEKVCVFKHKVHNWLKSLSANSVASSKKSCKSGSTKSRSSKHSSYVSKSFSEKAKEERINLVELQTEAEFLQRKAELKIKAEALEIQEKLAKSKAKLSIFEDCDEDVDTPMENEGMRRLNSNEHIFSSIGNQDTRLEECLNGINSNEIYAREKKDVYNEALGQTLNQNSSYGKVNDEQTVNINGDHNSHSWSVARSRSGAEEAGSRMTEKLHMDINSTKKMDYKTVSLQDKKSKIEDGNIEERRINMQGVDSEKLHMHADNRKGSYSPCNTGYVAQNCEPYGRKVRIRENSKLQSTERKEFLESDSYPMYGSYYESRYEKERARRNIEEIDDQNRDEENTRKSNMKLSEETTSKQLCKLLRMQAAPDVHIEIFKGDPMEFQYFMSIFCEAVEKRVPDQLGRLTRLLRFTEGEPKELIKHCIYQSQNQCYDLAKDLLYRQYGNHYRILAAYREFIKKLQPIKPNDSHALRSLFTFLLKVNGLQLGERKNPLDNHDTLCQILSKLPVYIQDRWNRRVLSMRKSSLREPTLADLIELVEEETTMIDDPLFSRGALNNNNVSRIKAGKSEFKQKVKTFNCNLQSEESLPQKGSNIGKKKCRVCGVGDHLLEKCNEYLKHDVEERNAIIFRHRLCFKCLKPVNRLHSAATCRYPKKCEVCQLSHPTSLHGLERLKQQEEAAKKSSTTQTEIDDDRSMINAATHSKIDLVSICLVPVQLSHTKSDKVVETYAMLDACSQGSFITEDTARKLSVQGTKTTLQIKTLNGEKLHNTKVITNLKVQALDSDDEWLTVSKAYTQEEIPINEEDVELLEELDRWDYLSEVAAQIKIQKNINVGLLIGANCPQALEPTNCVRSQKGGPYAVKTKLGWCVIGPIKATKTPNEKIAVNRIGFDENRKTHIQVENEFHEQDIKEMICNLYNHDFIEEKAALETKKGLSIEEKQFMKIISEKCRFINGKYEIPLPLKNEELWLPNNRSQAFKRMILLQRKFEKDPTWKKWYFEAMDQIFTKGYAEPALDSNVNRWYIPHHGVVHPNKPNKLRVVYDASAEFKGSCLNKATLKGPDLTSLLAGVLIRFREEEIALSADIEGMFFQVKLPQHQRSLFTFLWYKDNDERNPIIDYQMTAHIFGGTASPSCCNYALRRTASDNTTKYNEEVTESLKKNFYVDDMLKSVSSVQIAQQFAKDVKNLCAEGGFNLTKFISNNKNALKYIPETNQKKTVDKEILTSRSEEPTLGMRWEPTEDALLFKLNDEFTPVTKRGILSTVSSIYDPLGLISPFVLKGRRIIQKLCRNNSRWDDEVDAETHKDWLDWRKNLTEIQKIKINRCVKPVSFGEVVSRSLHVFSDASEDGYGVACYLRQVNSNEEVACNLVYGRSRVAPIKYISIPRMELSAALLAAKSAKMLSDEMHLPIHETHFWTDSKVVLGYILNEARNFKVFVANRVQQIQDLSEVKCWHYVASKENPADHASRGLTTKMEAKSNEWFNGPAFLHSREVIVEPIDFGISSDDKEVKKLCVNSSTQIKSTLSRISSTTNDWQKMVRIVVYMLRFINNSRMPSRKDSCTFSDLELQIEAKMLIVRLLQNEVYHKEVENLLQKKELFKNSSLSKLNPFLDDNLILRVGGRLKFSDLPETLKHPIILPKRNKITEMIIKHYHESAAHGGRNTTLNKIRDNGYWIVNASSQIRHFINKCVPCRRMFGRCLEQKMADLPRERCQTDPPFSYVGVDLFGPFIIKERRSCLKRYGVIFTCLNLRSVHLEVVHSLSTDSFMMALRRFIARRGNVRWMRSDNGSNFIGAENELNRAIAEMDQEKIKQYLLSHNGEWIPWRKNPPYASHMGGIWERQIRSARRILTALMSNYKERLNEESLNTLMTEVESLLNSRPLTIGSINDPQEPSPITPNSLLTMKSNVILPPPGNFDESDKYAKKQWRRTQFVLNEFWKRWKKEYLQMLQSRSKWNHSTRNLQIGDVVLLKEESERCHWPMGRVVSVDVGLDGNIRSAMLKSIDKDSRAKQTKWKYLRRPISKLVLLLENEGIDSPSEEPNQDLSS